MSLGRLQLKKKQEEVFYTRNQSFQKSIPEKYLLSSEIVIGFDTSSWILAERCKRLDKQFILDVSIAHPYEKEIVYRKINEQYPQWTFSLKQKSQFLINLELQEMNLADKVVVASTFSKNTLIKYGVEPNKIFVIPYGIDTSHFRPVGRSESTVVKFVFVGLVDARKGIPVLLDAWAQINKGNATLTIIGPIVSETEKMIRSSYSDIEIMGRLSHKQLPSVLSGMDVLVFPSYFEGYGLVITEAMACGLTVITTPATCGPDVLKDGLSGFIVECGDVGALADRMQTLTNDRSLLKSMKTNACKAVEQLSWDEYGNKWMKVITGK